MQENSQRSIDRMALKILLLVFLVTAIVFAWTSWSFKAESPTQATSLNAQGHLQVLGITLGEDTLADAEAILQSRSDIALYIYPQEHPRAGMSLEAFFPSIADHTKVILQLDADIAHMHDMEARATRPHLYPNQVARMNLTDDDFRVAHELTVTVLTLIPSTSISEQSLRARFGEPVSRRVSEDGSIRLDYPQLALQAILTEGEPAKLRFSNPK